MGESDREREKKKNTGKRIIKENFSSLKKSQATGKSIEVCSDLIVNWINKWMESIHEYHNSD